MNINDLCYTHLPIKLTTLYFILYNQRICISLVRLNIILFSLKKGFWNACLIGLHPLRYWNCSFRLRSLILESLGQCGLRLRFTCRLWISFTKISLRFSHFFRLQLPSSYSKLLKDQFESNEVHFNHIQRLKRKHRKDGSLQLVFFLVLTPKFLCRELRLPWVNNILQSNFGQAFLIFDLAIWNQGQDQRRLIQYAHTKFAF